jgi:proteic killer suppression protein
MIRSFRHRGLKALYDGRTTRRVSPAHVGKLRDILAVLDRSGRPDDMDLPGLRLHPLRGDLKGALGSMGLRQLAGDLQVRSR